MIGFIIKQKKLFTFFIIFLVIFFIPINAIATSVDNKNKNNTPQNEINLFSNPPDPEWEKSYGGGFRDYGEEVIELETGNYIVAGNYNAGSVENAKSVGWIFEINSKGDIVWDKKYGENENWFNNIKKIDEGFIAAGTVYNDDTSDHNCVLIKIDYSGNVIWEKNYGNNSINERQSDIEVMEDGFILLALSDAGGDLFNPQLFRINSNGDVLWKKVIDRTVEDTSEDAHLMDIELTNDDGFICAGYTQQVDNSNYDFWLIKFNSEGEKQWDRLLDAGSVIDWCYSIVVTDNQEYVLSGDYYYEKNDAPYTGAWVVKTDNNGDIIWDKKYQGFNKHAEANCITQNSDGSFIITGSTGDLIAPKTDFWIMKIDENGEELWSSKFGVINNYERGYFITQTSDKGYIAVGYKEVKEGQGFYNHDLWLIKLESDIVFKPNKPDGATSGTPNTEYIYSTSVNHPDGSPVIFGWDWDGDDNVDHWTDEWYESGNICEVSHFWDEQGRFKIKVKAKDENNLESEWSDPLSVNMAKNKVLFRPFVKLLERLFHIFPLLN